MTFSQPKILLSIFDYIMNKLIIYNLFTWNLVLHFQSLAIKVENFLNFNYKIIIKF